ncbi:dUTPase-like protein [Nemania sp. FL0916]|nr:dUTPase-like protein [Nemania sp. FL0916]
MLVSGASIIKQAIVRNLRSLPSQLQPCGIDVSLRRVLKWTSPATVDFDNARRRAAETAQMPFSFSFSFSANSNSNSIDETEGEGVEGVIKLQQGAYLVEFNETVHMPLDCMGQLFARSSLWRSGVVLTGGVVDAGYNGSLGALLDVRNPAGVVLYKYAKLAQVVVLRLEGGRVEKGYEGVYQGSRHALGRDGA